MSYYNGTSYSFTWQNGRQLATATLNGSTYTYKYNQDGIRLSKQYGNTLVEYIVDGTQIVCERTYTVNPTTNAKTLTSATVYSYDANGTPNGARVTVYSGSTTTTYNFFLRTNLQGDVLAIYDKSTKQQVVSFNYNAWGEYTTNIHNATLSQIALNYTHLRYRGYYQDTETGFYYLNSRYYDATMCRFINGDSYVNANGDFVGFNMYAYCSNNPVMRIDTAGMFWQEIGDFFSNVWGEIKDFANRTFDAKASLSTTTKYNTHVFSPIYVAYGDQTTEVVGDEDKTITVYANGETTNWLESSVGFEFDFEKFEINAQYSFAENGLSISWEKMEKMRRLVFITIIQIIQYMVNMSQPTQ